MDQISLRLPYVNRGERTLLHQVLSGQYAAAPRTIACFFSCGEVREHDPV